jgi:1-acyl-sn-glycerol-3-phosphate acyltransferase
MRTQTQTRVSSFAIEEIREDPRPVAKIRVIALACTAGLITTISAIVLIPIGALTLCRARRLYSAIARITSKAILFLYGIRIAVHAAPGSDERSPFPPTQTIYISNHTSTLDLFVLVALGLPNCRFFLSGFLRKLVPLGIISWLMGTFFTVPQDRPAERTRIFQRAERVLRRTGESVYLSPEGGRITTGEVGHFNRGAFHLATNLRVPIVPFFIQIPRAMDPGRGIDAGAGIVHVHVMPAIDTRAWVLSDLERNKARVRDLFVRMNADMRTA